MPGRRLEREQEMAITNYCKKCRAETSCGDICPRCGAKLTKAGERTVLSVERLPVADWFAWNGILRIVVPVIGLVLLIAVLLEGWTEGARGVQAVFVQGFFWTVMGAFAILLLVTLCVLLLQGRETVRYVLDGKGAHAYAYIRRVQTAPLLARFTTRGAVAALQAEAPEEAIDDLTLVRRADVSWAQVKRACFWPETGTILLYCPRYWLALSLRCAEPEYLEAEAIIRKRLSRVKGALPKQKRKSKRS